MGIILLSKASVKKEFSKEWEKHYYIELFRGKGFVRKRCALCGKNFWTLDTNRETCADPPCQNYAFINNTITKKKYDYIEMWRVFEKFFEKEGHTSVPRYPVVDRWRPDLFFTMASIQDFQRLENGNMTFEYPANPLVVPQVCLRFNDIPNVGVTGRHLTSFVMAGQHAFGYPKAGYFKDKCIELNFKFLTRELGIPEKELVYVEDVWAMSDFSAFGPSMETFSRGLELVNSVFMQFQSPDGISRKELDTKVIDVGWGLERLVWFSNGTPASYDSLFGPVAPKMKKLSNIEINHEAFNKYSVIAGNLNLDEVADISKARREAAKHVGLTVEEMGRTVEPLQALYAVADHARTLLFAIADGGIPSNVGGGYNLRIILRNALNFIGKYNFGFTMGDVASWHADYLKTMFPELKEGIDNVQKILGIEAKKYEATQASSRRIILSLFEKKEQFDEKLLTKLYESHGITPGLIEKVGIDAGREFHIRGDFYVKLAAKHEGEKKIKEKTPFDLRGMPATEKIYYKSDALEFDAAVLDVKDSWVILDRSAFYATGGGQDHDTGTIGGAEVVDVIKVDSILLHKVVGPPKFSKGDKVRGIVDAKRRKILTQMHTGAHVLGAAARMVLGPHIWQAGSAKTVEKSRLDVTHYESVTDGELKKIEDTANRIIKENSPVEISELPRGEAERKYGFIIYQGGGSPGKIVRIIKINGYDVEACGGTHVRNTGDIGGIKITGVRKIQDGVVRFEFVAGALAQEKAIEKHALLGESLAALGAKDINMAPAHARALFRNWKELRKIYGPLIHCMRAGKKDEVLRIKGDLAAFREEMPRKEEEKYDTESALKELAAIFRVQEEHVPKTIKRFNEEIRQFREEIERA